MNPEKNFSPPNGKRLPKDRSELPEEAKPAIPYPLKPDQHFIAHPGLDAMRIAAADALAEDEQEASPELPDSGIIET